MGLNPAEPRYCRSIRQVDAFRRPDECPEATPVWIVPHFRRRFTPWSGITVRLQSESPSTIIGIRTPAPPPPRVIGGVLLAPGERDAVEARLAAAAGEMILRSPGRAAVNHAQQREERRLGRQGDRVPHQRRRPLHAGWSLRELCQEPQSIRARRLDLGRDRPGSISEWRDDRDRRIPVRAGYRPDGG
jgi:hypothetical protein